MPRLLCFMCHPDDAEILAGGTLLLVKSQGWELGIATMTAGDVGSALHTADEIACIRLGEARAAADYLGASYDCAGLHDIEVFANAESLPKVVEIMRTFAPDVVITHSPADYMVDHEEASRLVRSAAFAAPAPLYKTRQHPSARPLRSTPALYYSDPIEGIDALGGRIHPHFYVDISEQMENKRRMLSCHESQREWLRSHHGIDEYLNRMAAWAELYGAEAGFRCAEGFRQHLGHGYLREPVLQSALGARIKLRT